MIRRILSIIGVVSLLRRCGRALDNYYLEKDRAKVNTTRSLRLIPAVADRVGGKESYGEWAHVIGVFRGIIYETIDSKSGLKILDAGCGSGLLGISSEDFVGEGGKYVGIDVDKERIAFARSNFPAQTHSFVHITDLNRFYALEQKTDKSPWPCESDSFDLVTALSVWTHFSEEDARFYLKEVRRVLRPNGRAIITFFILDEDYEASLAERLDGMNSRFTCIEKKKWIYDKPAYDSDDWFCPSWVKTPEHAIGIQKSGFESLLKEAGLRLDRLYPGTWKERPGLYFQDVAILSCDT